ncbi:hypothetical protein Fmac_028716 [Flemingia macrophylla]|uniref:Uncharacterized protein n=1 Tax=Flemingia macrophylla TaxID=520843 RepID=A0ABD1L899_9FABA
MSILWLMLQTDIADHHSSRDKALDREDGSQLLVVKCKNDAILRIRSLPLLQESSTSVLPMTTTSVSVLLRCNLEWMSILRLMLQTPIEDHHSSRDNALDREDGSQLLALDGKLDALVNLVNQLAANQKPAYVARVCGIRSSNDHHTSAFPSPQQSGLRTRSLPLLQESAASVLPMTTILVFVLLRSNLESISILRIMLQTPIADPHSGRDKALDREDGYQLLAKSVSVARVCSIRSSNDHHTSVCPSSQQSGVDVHPEAYLNARNDAIVIRVDHDVSTNTSAETRKLEGKLDALVNLVTQLAANQKPASVGRVCGIHSSIDHHTSVCPSSQKSGFSARNHANVIRGDHDVARDTSAETRKLEGKLDALVNLVTQLATNQKPSSVTRVCGIRSSNDHHTSVFPSSQQSGVDEHPEVMLQTSIANHHSSRDKALDREDGSQLLALAANQKPTSVARVCGIQFSNDNHTSVCPSSPQSGVDEHPQAYAANTATNDAIAIRGVHDVATDTSPKTRKLEGKLDALVNSVTQLTAIQKPASVARVCNIRSSNEHNTSVCPSSQQSRVDEHPEGYAFSVRNDANVIRGVHDVATDTSVDTRKLEGKLDALVNLVTQLAANQKPASVARVCGIRSNNDHHIVSVILRSNLEWMSILRLMLQTPAADDHSSRDKALDRKDSPQLLALEGNLDGLVKLVTQLAANQKPASVARVYDIRSSNDHHTSVCPSSQQSGLSARNDAMISRGVQDVATDTSAETRKLEGKLDALVNLVTQLATNQKLASVERVCDIRSSTNHHTSFSARNDAFIIRGDHDVATDTSVETRKLEGKLDALVNLVTQIATNQKPASVARVYDIRSSNDHDTSLNTSAKTRKQVGKLDALVNLVTQLAANQKPASVASVCGIRSSNHHHTIVCPSSQQSGVDEHPDSYTAKTYCIPPQQETTDTSAETRKLEGILDALVNLVTQLAANQKPASIERVCDIRSSNDHHTSVCRSSQQSGVDEHPEAYAAHTYSRSP